MIFSGEEESKAYISIFGIFIPKISAFCGFGSRSIFERDDTNSTTSDILELAFVAKLQIPTPLTSSIPLIFCGQEAFKTPFLFSIIVLSSAIRTALYFIIKRNVRSDFPLPDGPVINIPLFFKQIEFACMFLFIKTFEPLFLC